MIEALDDLDLDRAQRQVDRERARHVGVGVTAQDQAGPGVLEGGRVDLLAVAEQQQVAAVGGHEPDPARGRLAVRRDPDLDPDVGRCQRLDRDRAARIPKGRDQVSGGDPPAGDRDGRVGAIAMSTTSGDPSASASAGSVVPGSRCPQPIGAGLRCGPPAGAAGRDWMTMPRSTSGSAPPVPSTRTWRRADSTSRSAMPWNRVSPAMTIDVPGRPPPSGVTCRRTGTASGGSAIACSQKVTSSAGDGTASATPVWLAPSEPGRTVSAPPWPPAA